MNKIARMKSKIALYSPAVVLGGLLGTMAPKMALGVASEELDTDLGNPDLGSAVGGVINTVLAFLGICAVILFLYGGFLWMTAGGNEENVAKAKKIITATVIGLIIILISAAAVNFILGNLINETEADITGF